MRYQVRDVDSGSIEIIHDMNERNLPHVNSMPEEYFLGRLGAGGYFRAAYEGDGDRNPPLAFLLAMEEQAEYDSLNFLWFKEHYDRFVYIDRVVVGEAHRRAGLGAALYADLLEWARGRTPRLACEVNVRPANEPSLRFHERLGFAPVGTQETDGGRKTVSLMTRELGPA